MTDEKTTTPETKPRGPERSVSVWHVVEWVEHGKVSQKQSAFVLATSAIEAAQIVGEDESRTIHSIHQVCPISQLPGDKYRPMACGAQPATKEARDDVAECSPTGRRYSTVDNLIAAECSPEVQATP